MLPASATNRQQELTQFLVEHNLQFYEMHFLAADMSSRTYYRLSHAQKSYVLMDAPPPENVQQFFDVATFLTDHNIRAPQIMASDLIQGFLVLEDFGNQTFTKIMQRDTSSQMQCGLYQTATETLLSIHKSIVERPPFLANYDTNALLKETEVFADYYWPYIHKPSMPMNLKNEWQSLWQSAFHDIEGLVPSSIVLRDYHVDNLMILDDGACGVLDFQDGLWGPVVYDLVSLTEDARLNVSEEVENLVWSRYLETVEQDLHASYRFSGDVLSAGRHAKILGVFTRYLLKYGKDTKLQHLPHVEFLLKRSCERAGLIGILQFLKKYFPNQF